MKEAQAKELCLSLMKADTEEEVIRLLGDVGYWDDASVWRFYGDRETNFNTIGNQQSRPDAALVEKLINSVDARLMNECLVRGIDPEGKHAPQTLREAVALFFEDSPNPKSATAGRVSEWPGPKRTEVARGITLVASGLKPREGNPSFTISDCGEGQTPEMMANTLVSLDRSNKLRIPFVQGKFNMGGTGVLQFCGRENLQLVVSRRNPAIVKQARGHESDRQWGFTIVRREDPGGGRRNSVYTYLAPLGIDRSRGRGRVLSFGASSLPIFPDGRDPFARQSEWGTLIKLYEYSATGYKTHILMRDGLLRRVDLLLPEVALPVRFHECRVEYKGHEGSPDTTMSGLGVRLSDDKAENLEAGFPSSCPISAGGELMTATVYSFKKGRADTYRKNEGIIFTLNGQTHGHLTTDFFRRKEIGLSYLADSILVTMDCTKFSIRAREDLFMNSRDRLRSPGLRFEIESALEDVLKHHEGLRELKERRRRTEIESKLADSKPLEDVLKSVLRRSPTLARLFLHGPRVTNPFKTVQVQGELKEFQGKRFPTYFKFKGKDYGVGLDRECHANLRFRISFETDAANDYFSREADRGQFALHVLSDGARVPARNYALNLQNGLATLSAKLPEGCNVGDELTFVATVDDSSRVHPFENEFRIRVKEEAAPKGGRGGRRLPPGDRKGEEREMPSGIALPKVREVSEADWATQSPPFDQYTALRVKHAGQPTGGDGAENGADANVYDFFVNVDNTYLKAELKSGGEGVEVKRARFVNGLVLVGLALLHEEGRKKEHADDGGGEEVSAGEEKNVEDSVEAFSRALAPVLLPMIESLGTLDLEDVSPVGASGESV